MGTMRRPSFFILCAATLTLAVGANLAVFTVVNAIWLRPRPVAAPDRVVVISSLAAAGGSEPIDLVKLAQLDAFSRAPVFERVAGQLSPGELMGDFRPVLTLSRLGRPVETLCVTSNYFSVLGVHVRGRDFAADDDRAGAALVGILSDRLWRSAFQGDLSLIGADIDTSQGALRVIGIAAPDFGGARLGEHADLWIPRALAVRASVFNVAKLDQAFADRMMPLIGLARLKPGVSAAEAERAIAAPRTHFVVYPLSDVFGSPGHATTVLGGRTVVLALGVSALLVLAGGCTTLMALLIVNFERRRQEFGMRLALGGTRWQLARQIAGELTGVALAGAAGGLAASALAMRVLPALQVTGGVDLARLDLTPDWRVVAVGLAITIATLLIAAAVPLRRLATARLMTALVAPASTGGRASLSTRRAMLAVHTAATLIILVGAALFGRTLVAGLNRGAGFDVDRTVFVQLQPSLVEFFDPHDDPQQDSQTPRRLAAYGDVMRALASLPGVEVATQGSAPIGPYAAAPPESVVVTRTMERHVPVLAVSQPPDYLRALGVGPSIGRALEIADAADASPRHALISATFAAALGGAQTMMGSRVSVGDRTYQIVGIVPDMPCGSLRLPACGRVFTASDSRLTANGVGLSMVLRTLEDASNSVQPVQRAVSQRFPKAASLSVRTGRDLVTQDLSEARTGAWFFSGFGAIALVLGVGGVFGLVAYVVESRRREFGIRMALGAMPADLIRRVVGAALWPVIGGAAIGLGAAALLARTIRALIVGVALIDPVAYGTSAILMVAAAGASAMVAAWRLRRSSPIDALRQA